MVDGTSWGSGHLQNQLAATEGLVLQACGRVSGDGIPLGLLSLFCPVPHI